MPIVDAAIILDVRAKIDAQFGPINTSLLPDEQTACDAGRTKMATCIAESGIYSRDHALVTVPGITSGSSTATGSVS